ncbi:hypothetical protein ANN_19448 [Periplaneta americana]|uniref:Uncharacterized protein n=1 Tax=Periplaneta americana TaxID=6978 RepID=A0ABQ8S9X8_PERAM|nr:hypothetical protein ANN_19448 [Periplaneta americana]
MAGLCEGGNEPPSSLKASNIHTITTEDPLRVVEQLDRKADHSPHLTEARHGLKMNGALLPWYEVDKVVMLVVLVLIIVMIVVLVVAMVVVFVLMMLMVMISVLLVVIVAVLMLLVLMVVVLILLVVIIVILVLMLIMIVVLVLVDCGIGSDGGKSRGIAAGEDADCVIGQWWCGVDDKNDVVLVVMTVVVVVVIVLLLVVVTMLPVMVLHTGRYDPLRAEVVEIRLLKPAITAGDHRANHTLPPFWLDDRPPLLRHVGTRPAAGWSVWALHGL